MKKIKIQSPTRVDLAGGTLDLWPLYLFVGQAKTVNVAIDIMTTAEIEELASGQIILEASDINAKKTYQNLKECLADSDEKMTLLKSQVAYWSTHLKNKNGFHFKTSSQSPVGGGLGGSSSLTISCLKAFSEFVGYQFKDKYQMVHVAHNIEAQILKTPTGTQDYYPAITGGIGVIDYNIDGVTQEVLSVDKNQFSEQFLLVYTGKAHHSGLNNFEVMTKSIQKDKQTLMALQAIKEIADDMANVVIKKDWKELPRLFNLEYQSRIKLAEAFSSPEIEKLSEVSLRNGAEAVKICGAGGGGCVLVWCAPGQKERVAQACQNQGFTVMNSRPFDKII